MMISPIVAVYVIHFNAICLCSAVRGRPDGDGWPHLQSALFFALDTFARESEGEMIETLSLASKKFFFVRRTVGEGTLITLVLQAERWAPAASVRWLAEMLADQFVSKYGDVLRGTWNGDVGQFSGFSAVLHRCLSPDLSALLEEAVGDGGPAR